MSADRGIAEGMDETVVVSARGFPDRVLRSEGLPSQTPSGLDVPCLLLFLAHLTGVGFEKFFRVAARS